MSDPVEELPLKFARETPLPKRNSASCNTHDYPFTRSYTRAQAAIEQQAELAPGLLPQTSIPSKKRSRKTGFGIFVEVDVANAPFSPSRKKIKADVRVPLATRTDSANLTPIPSPHYPDTTFPFSPSDPLWENVENYDTHFFYMTPPSTPRSFSPNPSPSAYQSPHRTGGTIRPREAQQTRSPRSLPPPNDVTLYTALNLNTWRVSRKEIKVAHHKYAREHHPDKVTQAHREEATHLMQTANAAAEVLLDSKRRRAYHRSGRLPWTM